MKLGYKASAEQFGPGRAARLSRRGGALRLRARRASPTTSSPGATTAATRRRRSRGSAPRRQRTEPCVLGTSVLTPTLRYHPSIIAQAFATLGCLAPGRVFLGVGTGEAMNETPVTGGEFPGRKERRLRLAEAIELIRLLWTEERVDFEGDYYRTAQGHDLRPARRAGADLRRRLRARSRPSSPAASATASSAPAARTRRSTTSCSARSSRAPRRPAATPRRSAA